METLERTTFLAVLLFAVLQPGIAFFNLPSFEVTQYFNFAANSTCGGDPPTLFQDQFNPGVFANCSVGEHDPQLAVDRDPNTWWQSANGDTPVELVLSLEQPSLSLTSAGVRLQLRSARPTLLLVGLQLAGGDDAPLVLVFASDVGSCDPFTTQDIPCSQFIIEGGVVVCPLESAEPVSQITLTAVGFQPTLTADEQYFAIQEASIYGWVAPGYYVPSVQAISVEGETGTVVGPQTSVAVGSNEGEFPGFTGPGYAVLQFTSAEGETVQWMFPSLPRASTYQLVLRYANIGAPTSSRAPTVTVMQGSQLYTPRFIIEPSCLPPCHASSMFPDLDTMPGQLLFRLAEFDLSEDPVTVTMELSSIDILVDSIIALPVEFYDPSTLAGSNLFIQDCDVISGTLGAGQVLELFCLTSAVQLSAEFYGATFACDCHSTGTVEDTTCDPTDGVCTCKEGVGGRQCDSCLSDSFGFSDNGCQACDCNSTGTVEDTTCDPFDGVCTCKEGVGGRRCDSCLSGSFGFSERGCHRELDFGFDYLPFIYTGDSAVSLEHNPNDDDCSNPISISDFAFNTPLPFGSTNQTVLYVCENGLISFGSAWDGSLANATANTTFKFPLSDAYLIAPLWSDVDISDPLGEGEIFYQINPGGGEALYIVNRFIEYQYNISFAGEWIFVATWNNVHPIPQASDPRANTYQAVIITDGNQAYVVFTYQCGSLEWTETMHLGILSTVGFSADEFYYENHPLSRTENLAEIACQNNDSGVPWSNVIYALNPAVFIKTPPECQIVDFLELQSGTPLQLSCSAAFFGVTEVVSVQWSYLDNLCVCAIGDTQPDSPLCSNCEQTAQIGSQSVNTITATLTIQQVTTPEYTCQIFSTVQVGVPLDSATTTITLQVPPPNVSISAEGSGLFGEPYNLTCTVELADISITRAGIITLIEWLVDAPGGDISQGPTYTDSEGTITSRTLSFSFLNAFQHNGVYVCRITFIDSSALFLLPPEIEYLERITVPPGIIAADNKIALLRENITLAFTVFASIEQISWHFQANGDVNFNSIDIVCGELILLAESNSTLQLLCAFGEGYEFNLSIIEVTPEAAGSYILNVTDRTGITVQNTSTLTVQPFDVTQCGRLCDIATIVEPEEQAEGLVNIIANTEELDTDDIATASILLDDLTESAIADIEVLMDYLQTIDNVLQADPSVILESQLQNQSSTRILYSLGNVTANVSLPGTSMIYTGVTYGLYLQDVDATNFEGRRFSINLGSVEEATRSDRTSVIDPTVISNMLTQDATANVEVSENLDFDQSSRDLQRLVLSFYLRDSFFQVINTTISSIIVGVESPNVITASSLPQERRRRQTSEEELLPAVNLELQVAEDSEETNCSNFDPGGNGGVGAWSSDSCRSVACPPEREQQTCCECYQLGHFGLLLAPTPTALPEVFNNLLTVFSYIGAGLSLICLLLTLVTYLSSRKLRNKIAGQLLLNLAVSLIGLYIAFITAGNILVYGKSTTTEVLCGINSALIQYFLLVYFGWTAAEAVQIYYWKILKAVTAEGLTQHLGHYVLKVALIVWLVPLVIVGVSAGAGYRFYTSDVYCRVLQWPFWFALVLPCGVIFIFDWIVFILIMKAILEQMRKKAHVTKYNKVKKKVQKAALLITLFGLGWVFGLVATGFPGEDTEVLTFILQIFFCIIVGLQGVLIFFFNVVQLDEAKAVWKGWYSKLTKHLPSIGKYKVSKRQDKRKLTPRLAARDGTAQGLTLSLSRDDTLSPGTPSPRQQIAESLTVTEGLETSTRYHPHTPAINTQAQPWITSPSSMSEEFVSSPFTDTSSLVDFENFDLVDWV